MEKQQLDPSIYGYEEPTDYVSTTDTAKAGNYTPPKQVPMTDAFKGSGLLQEGEAALRAARREEATVLESIQAAGSQWLPAKALKYATAPSFDWEPGHNAAGLMGTVPFPLSSDEREFLLKTKSRDEFLFRLQNLDDERKAYAAMGDHGIASAVTMMLDPGYLALDIALAGTGRLAALAGAGVRTQRAVAGAATVAGTYAAGKLEQRITPISETEVVLNALGNGIATSAFYNPVTKQIQKVDPVAPNVRHILDDIAERYNDKGEVARVKDEGTEVFKKDIQEPSTPKVDNPDGVPVQELRGKVHGVKDNAPYTEVSGKDLLSKLSAHQDPYVGKLAERVLSLVGDDIAVRYVKREDLFQGSRAYYHPKQHAAYISKDTPDNIVLHEIAHAVTNHKIRYGKANPDSVHGKLVSDLNRVLSVAKEEFGRIKKERKWVKGVREHDFVKYHISDLDEFVAGLYTGDSAFTKMLAQIKPVEGTKSLLESAVAVVRKLLGFKASEENALLQALGLADTLMQQRLNVTMVKANSKDVGDFSIRLSPEEQYKIISVSDAKQTLAKKLAHDVSWSLHKTMGKYSSEAKRIADLLVDDPLSMAGDSVASQHRAVRADLYELQYKYEDLLADALAERGFGLLKRILSPKKAVQSQVAIEREVGFEMLRRNRLAKDGATNVVDPNVPKHITEMADALDAVSKRALDEMKRAGVKGADDIADMSGYFSRRWDVAKIEGAERKLMDGYGLTQKEARGRIVDMVSVGIQRQNGWDPELASDVAKAIIDRSIRKGYFEDSAFRAHQGADAAKEVRDLLTGSGLPEARIQRVLDVITGKADEKGKASHLKQRIDMAMDESMRLPDGTTFSIADLVDMNMAATTERYLDGVATDVAFARKGLTSSTDVQKLREEYLGSITGETQRKEAAYLFDQTLNALRGLPTGEDMPGFMRKSQAVTQMVGLAYSGLWQTTEIAVPMMRYGALRTFGAMMKEMPFVRSILSDAKEAGHLQNVLSRNSSMDVRIRPYVQRMEDGYDIPISDSVQLGLMQAKQLVPYINAMKYVQRHQARTVANLVVNTFERAAKGDVKAVEALGKYGLEPHILEKVRADIVQHGMDTQQWSHATWSAVRGPLTKMMDDSVLKARTGEMPAFAQFSQAGKFIFTFRSFTLSAHNKVMAGTMSRDGFMGLGLLMAYQFPLTVLATGVANAVSGKPPLEDGELVAKSFTQMGSLGLAGELLGVATGQKQQWGSPGFIGVDRVYKLGNALGDAAFREGSAGDVGSALISATPLLAIVPGSKALGEALKD